MHPLWRRARLLAAWLLAVYLARMYLQMGWVKFDPEGLWTAAHDARWVDVAWISAYLLGLAWIGYEWWGFRLRLRKSQPAAA
jgi:hypothetical protein